MTYRSTKTLITSRSFESQHNITTIHTDFPEIVPTAPSALNLPLTSQNLSIHTDYHNERVNISLNENCGQLDQRAEALKATLMTLDVELPDYLVRRMAERYDDLTPANGFLRES